MDGNENKSKTGEFLLTPSKLVKDNTGLKRNFNSIENEHENINDLIENLNKQLEKEKQNNEFLKTELSEMRKQSSTLTETITDLKETVNKLTSHNKNLLKQVQKKEEKKKPSPNKIHKAPAYMSHQNPQNNISNTDIDLNTHNTSITNKHKHIPIHIQAYQIRLHNSNKTKKYNETQRFHQ